MFSKWLDACTNLAAYHYQSDYFSKIAPPSFGNHPELQNFTRNRKRVLTELTMEEYTAKLDILQAHQSGTSEGGMGGGVGGGSQQGLLKFLQASRRKARKAKGVSKPKNIHRRQVSEHKPIRTPDGNIRRFVSCRGDSSTDPNTHASESYELHRSNSSTVSSSMFEDPIASPFLEEAVHLFSLLSAVALSTLRNDIPEAPLPLVKWEPDDVYPHVDPDHISYEKSRHNATVNSNQLPKPKKYSESHFWTTFFSLLGVSRTPIQRTIYNQGRPFQVLGGISVREMKALNEARGGYAKVSLCYLWIQEFISREQLLGGLGTVPSPIVSRCYQFASDGMKGYNECRKIAKIPFPFPHEQLTSIFIMIILWVFPVLFYSFVNNMAVACLLNYSTVLCFVGLHEVAREMESPFMRVPNNLPLNTFQAQYNEALITTWAGYHPDSWFDLPESDTTSKCEENEPQQIESCMEWSTFLVQQFPPTVSSQAVGAEISLPPPLPASDKIPCTDLESCLKMTDPNSILINDKSNHRVTFDLDTQILDIPMP
jgi:Bestrophin, RFP-TM, chloride channel